MVFPQDLPVRPGIIPARAGFTLGDLGDDLLNRDHPRSRGVYKLTLAISPYMRGSSPLARGLQTTQSPPLSRAGIIPARAGFTTGRPGRGPPRRDHPRSRGVYNRTARSWASSTGSSPLARGLRSSQLSLLFSFRIIPARAGFTPGRPDAGAGQRDHPRSRGVYASQYRVAYARAGSSPLARGLPGVEGAGRAGERIIPARAGFTVHWGCADLGGSDHPRSRGVYRRQRIWTLSSAGSSPLARGLPAGVMHTSTGVRIIPARAGFTYERPGKARPARDHPRSRGVYQ